MKINELEPGKNFIVEASGDDRYMQLKGTIANITAEKDLVMVRKIEESLQGTFFCIADSIRQDNKLLNFKSEKVACNLVVVLKDEKPYAWNNVKIVNFKLPVYGNVHLIVSKFEAVASNRRQNYRVFVGLDGVATSEGGTESINILVKDVSASGIGLISKNGDFFKKGSRVVVSFHEPEMDADLDVKAAIVRKEEMDDGRFSIGCVLKSHKDVMAKLVYSKQKKKMQRPKKGAPAEAEEQEENSEEEGSGET